MPVTPVGLNANPTPESVIKRSQPAPSAPVVAARADRIERSPATESVTSHSHGLGLGLITGAAAEGGIVGGTGASASAGAGLFFDPRAGIKPGAFASAGAFFGKAALGAFAGAGVGAFVTNAGSAAQLAGDAQTSSLNVGVGPLKVSLSLGVSNGTYAASLSFGPGIGVDVSTYRTQTSTTQP